MAGLGKRIVGSKRILDRAHAKRKADAKSGSEGFLHRDMAAAGVLASDSFKPDQGALTTGIARKSTKSGEFLGFKHGRKSGPTLVKVITADGSVAFVAGYPQAANGVAGPGRRVPAGIGKVIVRASKLLGSKEAAVEWLNRPSRWLDNRSPLDMIQAGEREDVDRYLEQIEYGVYV